MTNHDATQHEGAKHHGTLTLQPPTPEEELANLGLVTSESEDHVVHHPQPGSDKDSHPTTAGSPVIRRTPA